MIQNIILAGHNIIKMSRPFYYVTKPKLVHDVDPPKPIIRPKPKPKSLIEPPNIPMPLHMHVIGDHVSFTHSGVGFKNKTRENAACYAWSQDVQDDIVCMPRKNVRPYSYYSYLSSKDGSTKSRLSADDYQKLFSLLKKNHICPGNAEAYTKDDCNYLHIPPGNNWYKRYATLCFYRDQDAKPEVIYAILRLSEQFPDLNFFQIFHYARALYGAGAGHHFSTIAYIEPNQGSYYSWQSIIASAIMPYFFRSSLCYRKKAKIGALFLLLITAGYRKFEGEKIALNPVNWNIVVRKPKHLLQRKEDILDERWKPLYEMKKPTDEKLKAMYNKLGKELCNGH